MLKPFRSFVISKLLTTGDQIYSGVVTEIEDPEAHLVFYQIEWGEIETNVQVVNQFGSQTLNIEGPYLLAVPSEKMSPYPALPPAQ